MKRLHSLSSALLALFLLSCAGGTYLRTEGVKSTEGISGTFRLILYGANYQDDFETVAILDLEGDGYEIVPFAPEYLYSVSGGLNAEEAFEAARHFVRTTRNSHKSLLKRVMDSAGATIGYEVRPLYFPFFLGGTDLIYVDYYLQENGVVKVIIQLKERYRKRLDEEGVRF